MTASDRLFDVVDRPSSHHIAFSIFLCVPFLVGDLFDTNCVQQCVSALIPMCPSTEQRERAVNTHCAASNEVSIEITLGWVCLIDVCSLTSASLFLCRGVSCGYCRKRFRIEVLDRHEER